MSSLHRVPFLVCFVLSPAALLLGSGAFADHHNPTEQVEQNSPRVLRDVRQTQPTQRPELSRGTLTKDRTFYVSTTQLKLVVGSGEFEFIKDAATVQERQSIGLQWQTKETNAVRGRWEVRDRADLSTLVASGVLTSAPQPEQLHRVTLEPAAFLREPQPISDTVFEIRIQALDASNAPVGKPSNAVTVKQLSRDYVQPPTDFGAGARFPTVTLIDIEEKVGQLPLSQIYSTHADVRVRVSNNGNQPTDKMSLKLRDKSLLFRHTSAAKAIKALSANESITVSIRMQAILGPATSQTPQQQQVREWRQRRETACSPVLYSMLDWRGNQSQTPIDPHRERPLLADGWEDEVTSSPSAPVCDGNQCVRLLDIERGIAKRLHGQVMGYSFALVGAQTNLGASGKARSAADGDIDFTPQTPMTVASVAKWITAIGAMSVANTRTDVSINDTSAAYYPADWNVGGYFGSVTLSQFLSQQSGIKDYGNVKMSRSTLEDFFEQTVSNGWTPSCTGPAVRNPPNAVNPSNAMTRCYSNINFAVFREFIPAMVDAPGNANDQYERLVRENVFERVGRDAAGCRPIGDVPHAFGYPGPDGEHGEDWGDVRDQCGGAGWYVSAADMAAVLSSMNARDGLILRETATVSDLNTMRMRGLGLDTFTNREMSKNGAWGSGKGLVHAGAAIFGPVTGPNVLGALLINSTIVGGQSCDNNAMTVLRDAYNEALYTK